MISRRNIRVKVMQTLYSLDAKSDEKDNVRPIEILNKKLEESRLLFSYLVYFITEVARFSETDARKKASKHLPSAKDLSVNTKIAGNELLWKILEDKSYQGVVAEAKFERQIDTDLLKSVYSNLVVSPEYIEYIETASRDKKSEKKILEFIFSNLMLPNEHVIHHIEEHFINWDDDADMMQTLVLNFLNKPSQFQFNDIISQEKRNFAHSLLNTVIDKKEHSLELIKPKLKNWDAERIAALDLIILQMGVCELLFFETIPTKVTINEYIDLAKEYSTAQSGQFVNGLLDNLHKELSAQNKIVKKNFKNSVL